MIVFSCGARVRRLCLRKPRRPAARSGHRPDPVGIELVGDGPLHSIQLHYGQRRHAALRRGGAGPGSARRAPAWISRILVRLARVFRTPGGAGLSCCRAGPARLQPEQQARKPGGLSARTPCWRHLRPGRRPRARAVSRCRTRLGRGGGLDDGGSCAEAAAQRRDAAGAASGDLARCHAQRSRPAAQEPLRSDAPAAVALRNDAEDRQFFGSGARVQNRDAP